MQSGDQLFHLERLGKIVIGTSVDAFHPLHPTATRRENDDWHVLAVGAPTLEDSKAIHPRKTKIENHGRKFLGVTEEPRILSIVRESHVETAALQPLPDAVSDCDLVLDHQNSHGYPFRL